MSLWRRVWRWCVVTEPADGERVQWPTREPRGKVQPFTGSVASGLRALPRILNSKGIEV